MKVRLGNDPLTSRKTRVFSTQLIWYVDHSGPIKTNPILRQMYTKLIILTQNVLFLTSLRWQCC